MPDQPTALRTAEAAVVSTVNTLIRERDELRDLLLHMNVLPHHARPFKAGGVDFAGCPSCAKIRDVWFEHGRLWSERDPEQQAAFVPPEDADTGTDAGTEDLSDAAHNSPAE